MRARAGLALVANLTFALGLNPLPGTQSPSGVADVQIASVVGTAA